MLPIKLGLAYESCFGDPYRTRYGHWVNNHYSGGAWCGVETSCDQQSGHGWLTAVLECTLASQRGEMHVGPSLTATSVLPATLAAHAQPHTDAHPPVTHVAEQREKGTPVVSADEVMSRQESSRSPSEHSHGVQTTSAEDSDGERMRTDGGHAPHSRASSHVADEVTPLVPARRTSSSSRPGADAERQFSNESTSQSSGHEKPVGVAVVDVSAAADMDRDVAEAAEETRARQRHRLVDEELRGGVVARGETNDTLAELVERLYEKLRVEAVHATALDDLHHQLAQLKAATQPASTNADAEKRFDAPYNRTAGGGTALSEQSGFDRRELAISLYTLRDQVTQLKEVLAVADAEQAAAQRQRQRDAARSAKSGRHIRVEVVRAYDSPPQPRLKPPFQPAALPPSRPMRSKGTTHKSTGGGHRSVLEVDVASSSRPQPPSRWTSLYHDGTSGNFEVYSSEEEFVRRRPERGEGRRGRRQVSARSSSFPPLSSASVLTTSQRTAASRVSSPVSSEGSSLDARSGKRRNQASFSEASLTSSSDARSFRSGVASETESSHSTSPSSPRNRKKPVVVASSSATVSSSNSRAETSSDASTDGSEETSRSRSSSSRSTASSTGADIFWKRRMEALKQKKAREAAAQEKASSSRSDSSPASSLSRSEASTASSASSPTRWSSETVSDEE